MIRKYILLLFFGALTVAVGCFFYKFYFKPIQNFQPKEYNKIEILSFPELNEQVFFKAKIWGISGDNNAIVVTTQSQTTIANLETDKDYIFYSSELFYKKVGKDSLFIYVNASSITSKKPKIFSQKIKEIIVPLKTQEENLKFNAKYKEMGLIRVAAFQ
jgi:hypothetical protein